MSGGVEKYVVAAVPVATGAACWVWGSLVPFGWLSGVVVGGCVMLFAAWLFVPEERSTALVRIAMYVGALLMGSSVLLEFWKLWSSYVLGVTWGSLLDLLRGVAIVQGQLEGLMVITPWVAAALTFFGVYFTISVLMALVSSFGGGEEGKKRSESELFGKSKLMSQRVMRKMSQDGG